MYIAMNRFKIALGKEPGFETLWRERDSHLEDVPGFKKFNLLKGKSNDTYTLYASHSTWLTENDFVNWTQSESFRKAHGKSKAPEGTYLGHPEFEGFEVIL